MNSLKEILSMNRLFECMNNKQTLGEDDIINQRKRLQLLRELNKSEFNFIAFSTKNIDETEEVNHTN